MAYEGVLLFGVVMSVGLVYALVTQQRHALVGTAGLRALLFVALGIYFVGFWSHSGQTLAMQTWRIRVVTASGEALSPLRALCRYVLAWMWFAPALAALALSGLKGALPALLMLGLGVIAYAAASRMHGQRQYWHDVVCRTRLITWPPEPCQEAHDPA
jgi:uncharacterized RDD family membrane protein YckC